MDYGKYKNARNAAWQCILDYGIHSLPVKVTDIIHQSSNIRLFKNSVVQQLGVADKVGKTIYHDNMFEIVYNDADIPSRCRFTIAHELGHIFLGDVMTDTPRYRTFAEDNDIESAANVFARDLLAPACVLHELGATTANGISKLCNISIEAAAYRAERMVILEKRNAWYRHPLERQVRKQFETFIKSKLAE